MKPFIPELLPLENLEWLRFIELIGPANYQLARFEGIIQSMINPQVLLSPLLTNEAVLSSKIEGTQATLEEVLKFEAVAKDKIETEREKDIQEIINYRKSIFYAVEWLKEKPITLNLIKKIHGVLLDSVRGKDKRRGEFRNVQNWIGRPGAPLDKADYVPPEPLILHEYLANFEKYIHYQEKDFLVQLALVHAQFEIIHPFLDGNGRLGRILVPLFLYEKDILSSPVFYISGYLEEHRDEYVSRLRAITQEGRWEEWVVFFLKVIYEQAKKNSLKAQAILNLYQTKKGRIQDITHSKYIVNIIDTLFANPIFSSTDFIKRSDIPKRSALRFLDVLEKEGVISVLLPTKGNVPAIFMFKKLVEIIK